MKIQTKILLLTMVGLVLTAGVIVGAVVYQLNRVGDLAVAQIETFGNENLQQMISDGRSQEKRIRQQILTEKKAYLKSQVQTTISVLEKAYRDAHNIEKLKTVYRRPLKNAVDTAYGVIAAVAKRADLDRQQKQQLARQLIKELRYGPESKDYFWINDTHPKMVMHPYKPKLDGKDLSGFKDPNGKKLFVAFVDICRQNGEGFVDYHWPKYGADTPQPKLSFVKLFREWNWIIGTGVYLEVAENQLKADATQIIKALRYGPESKDYFWINDLHPKMVMHPYKPQLDGKDLSEVKDPNGKKLFVAFADVCRQNGEGFVDYDWPKYGADTPQPKLSFVKLFPKWNWIIGTGVYIDDVDQLVAARHQEIQQNLDGASAKITRQIDITRTTLHAQIQKILGWMATVVLGLLVVVLAISHQVARRSISKPIQRVITGLTAGSGQVAAASGQITAAGQQLAQGASDQAAALQQTASSLEEMSATTQQNADNARQADVMMKESVAVVSAANEAMGQLNESMDEISKASEKTSKIIKTIDDIAFQTNLLALNAAVEAARAGEAGAGFAVVADEVRNLAMRAADAAKTTAGLIETTGLKVCGGTEIVTRSNEAFKKVSTSATKVAQLIGEIAAASNEQANGIQQINRAIDEIDQVTQQNAANAEETASASAEMNTQAEYLDQLVDELLQLAGSTDTVKSRHGIIISKSHSEADPSDSAAPDQSPCDRLPSVHRAVDPATVIPMDELGREQQSSEFKQGRVVSQK